jgi:uridine kinase
MNQNKKIDNNIKVIFNKIDYLLQYHGTILVAIDGNCCAGKSTLASLIANTFYCNLFHMDHFFLPTELRTKERFLEIGGNIDYLRFRNEVILGIKSKQPFIYRVYCCKKKGFTQTISVTPKKLNIIEGVYSMHPTLINDYNLKIFLHIDGQEQSRRILNRNGETIYGKFKKEWIPMENQYFKEYKIMKKCDIKIFRE